MTVLAGLAALPTILGLLWAACVLESWAQANAGRPREAENAITPDAAVQT